VHYDVPVFKFYISIAFHSLNDVWQRRAPDTVFVDGDLAATVAPWGAPLVCILSMHRFNLASRTKKIVFLGDSAGPGQCGIDQSDLSQIGLKRFFAEYKDSNQEKINSVYPSIGLITWPGRSILGPSIDPTRPGTLLTPLNSFLLCLVRHAESMPIASHEFDLGKVLSFFSGSLQPGEAPLACANLLTDEIIC
jgi:hypothetical protein